MKRANDMLSQRASDMVSQGRRSMDILAQASRFVDDDSQIRNSLTTRGNYADPMGSQFESINKAKLDGMFGVEFGERVHSDAAVIPTEDGTLMAPFEPTAPEFAFSQYLKMALPKTRVVCGIVGVTEFLGHEKEKCLAVYETYKKDIGLRYGEMAALNRKNGSSGVDGSEEVCQSVVECAARRIITLMIRKSAGGRYVLQLTAADIDMVEKVVKEWNQEAAELPTLEGLFGMSLGMRIEPTENEEMFANGSGVQLFTPSEPFLDFELYAIKFLPKSRVVFEITAVHTCKTRFAASEIFTKATRQIENMFKQKTTDITANFNTTGPDEIGEQRIKAAMIAFPNTWRFLFIEQVKDVDCDVCRVRVTAHDRRLFSILESEVKALDAADASGLGAPGADGKTEKGIAHKESE